MYDHYYSEYYCDSVDYSDVQIIDCVSDDIASSEKVVFFSELYHKPSPSYDSGYSKSSSSNTCVIPRPTGSSVGVGERFIAGSLANALHRITNFATMNPPDGAVIVCDDAFKIVFGCKGSYQDSSGWDLFSSNGAIVHLFETKISPSKEKKDGTGCFSIQKYRIQLKAGVEIAHLQFIQMNRHGLTIKNKEYPYGALINVYVYRKTAVRHENNIYPSIYSLKPTFPLSFLPLIDNQRLQIIAPHNYDVECVEPQLGFKSICRMNSAIGDYKLNYFSYEEKSNENIAAVLMSESNQPQNKSLVIIPSIRIGSHGERWALINAGFSEFVVYCNNVSGFIFCDNQSHTFKPKMWLDDKCILKVESNVNRESQDGKTAFELQARLVDKTRKALLIKNLLNKDGCSITEYHG